MRLHTVCEKWRKERTIEFVPSDKGAGGTKADSGLVLGGDVREYAGTEAGEDEMDDWIKEVLHRWAFDEPWDEISEDMGVTTNALKKRFAYYLKKIRSRMLNANRAVSAKG